MRVRISMDGVAKEDIDYLINYDLPAMKQNIKREMVSAYEFLSNDKKAQKTILDKISSFIKKKVAPEYLSDALSYIKEIIENRELLEYKILFKSDKSIIFEIYVDNLFFKLMEAGGPSFLTKLYSPFILTKKKWLERLEKAIKNDYKPEFYKIEVIEE